MEVMEGSAGMWAAEARVFRMRRVRTWEERTRYQFQVNYIESSSNLESLQGYGPSFHNVLICIV